MEERCKSKRTHSLPAIGQVGRLDMEGNEEVESETKDALDSNCDATKSEEMVTMPCRRSTRTDNRIRMTAAAFQRRMELLFFTRTSKALLTQTFGSRYQITRVHTAFPYIYKVDGFLSETDLEYFDEKIASIQFEKSFVDNMNYGQEQQKSQQQQQSSGNKRQKRTIVDESHRTSTFFAFRKLQDSKIAALERRVADFLGCWGHQIEAFQLVRYQPGQFFGLHHDLGDLQGDNQVILPKKHFATKRRIATIFCYLNSLDDDAGGCTHFPLCKDLRIKPKRGRAILWSNVTKDGEAEQATIHQGEPVISTLKKGPIKYGLNIWICEE